MLHSSKNRRSYKNTKKNDKRKEKQNMQIAFTFRGIPVQLGNQLYFSFILDRKVIEDEKPSEKK